MTPPPHSLGLARYSLGLVGYPLKHSLSPRLHAAALEQAGLEGEYRLYPFPPTEEGSRGIEALLRGMRRGEVQGLNLTIPHKRTILKMLDELTPTAEAVGAVNTVYLREGRLVGDNSDVAGFRCDLDRQLSASGGQGEQGTKTALVLGAGGAARAVAYALVEEDWEVKVAARRLEQAQELARSLGVTPARDGLVVSAMPLEAGALRELLAERRISLVVNATPLGMSPALEGCAWSPEVPFPGGAFVYDLVYHPPETRLLRAARAAGLPSANGLGMLVEQAAASFEAWTGVSASREAMYAAVT